MKVFIIGATGDIGSLGWKPANADLAQESLDGKLTTLRRVAA